MILFDDSCLGNCIHYYHGGTDVIEIPRLDKTSKYSKDFGDGFYCTIYRNQAVRWAKRKSKILRKEAIINRYSIENLDTLSVKRFNTINDEWLDFVVSCRTGKMHNYDIVEGPMADDTIFNTVNDYINGVITKKAFYALIEFKYPTHQICFCTDRAVNRLLYKGREVI